MKIGMFDNLPPGTRVPSVVNAIIETPKGSRNKFEVDKTTGLMRLDRLLYSSSHYPGDYGFIPRTLAEDGVGLRRDPARGRHRLRGVLLGDDPCVVPPRLPRVDRPRHGVGREAPGGSRRGADVGTA